MQKGWIKVHRSLLLSDIFQNEKLLKVFMYCLLKASHQEHEVLVGLRQVKLQPGQFVFGRKKAAHELDMKESTVWKYMKVLEGIRSITLNSNNKFTLVTVDNWGFYQFDEGEKEQQNNNKITTKEQQNNTNKNVKNGKNDKNNYYVEIIQFLNKCAGTNYRHTTKKTRELIHARMNEGFTVDDFKTVIEYCCREWKGKTFGNGELGDSYLRPSTLFNNKFDERLNKAKQNIKQNPQQETSTTYKPISFDFSKGEG